MAETVKLLIIDDEEVVILGVKRILQNDQLFNYTIDFAYSAEEGLNKSLQNTYNVIISDIVMPGMDGMELLQKLLYISSFLFFPCSIFISDFYF